jgi:hypothetical protein
VTPSTATLPSGHWPVLTLVHSAPTSSGERCGWRLGGDANAYSAYNPDWGIARRSNDGEVALHPVRETKGSTDLDRLQCPHEKCKILCAQQVSHALGVSYHGHPIQNKWSIMGRARSEGSPASV